MALLTTHRVALPHGVQHVRQFASRNLQAKVEKLGRWTRGSGGRSSVSGVVATVFGCTGFLGRYAVHRLGRIGSQVVVPYRGDEHDYRHLKVMGDLGQIVPIDFSPRDYDSIVRASANSNVVINLMGKHYETKNFSFEDVNVDLARSVARAARETNAAKLIHVSAMGARPDSPSSFLRSKAAGEKAVLEEFPGATILRPCYMFGTEDNFLNTLAAIFKSLHMVPLLASGTARMQPVSVSDVADAILECVLNPATDGKLYELGGPQVVRLKEVIDFVATVTERKPLNIPLPGFVANMYAAILEKAPFPLITRDMVKRLQTSCVAPKGSLGLEDLEVTPTEMSKALYYLRRYRKGGGSSDVSMQT